jgi:hypothetical protein
MPELQKKPVRHWLSRVQVVPQEAPMQTLGLQASVTPGVQVPVPLQVLAAVSVAMLATTLQPPGAQMVPAL